METPEYYFSDEAEAGAEAEAEAEEAQGFRLPDDEHWRANSKGYDTGIGETDSMESLKNVADDEVELIGDEERGGSGERGLAYYARFSWNWTKAYVRSITWKGWLKLGLLALALLALLCVLVLLPWDTWLGDFLDWVESLGVWGPVILAEVYVAACILMIPGSILTIGAGFVFKSVIIGTVTVSIGSTIGCFAAFLYGNTLFRKKVEQKVLEIKVFNAIDVAVAKKGWLVVLLLRLSPVVPFNVINYAFGLTRIGLLPYTLASWIGMLPGTVAYVYIGTTLVELTQLVSGDYDGNAFTICLFIVGLIATFACLILISYFAKVQIQKIIKEAQEEINNSQEADFLEEETNSDVAI